MFCHKTCISPVGSVPNGVVTHPDGQHIIYPLGCTVIVKNLVTHKQTFLRGHSDIVSCVACSQSGEYLASGQVTYMGFKADVIVWQFNDRSLYCRLTLHKVKVQALAFSPNDRFLATLGGPDDNRYIVNVLPFSFLVQFYYIVLNIWIERIFASSYRPANF